MTCNGPFGFFVVSTVGFLPAGLMLITRIIRIDKKTIVRLASSKSLPLRADGRLFEVGLSQSFLEYGLWQDYATGCFATRGNSGDLGRAKKRQRRRWFSRKYYASVMRLKEFLEENIGAEFCGILSSALSKGFRRNY